MADSKVSALTAATTPASTDEIPCNQSGTSKKLTLDQIAMYCSASNFALLAADYTLTSTTSAQKLFNTTTNGAVTLAAGLYFFECAFEITGLSSTSGNGVFSFAGTATQANPRFASAFGLDSTTLVTGAALGGSFVQGGLSATTSIVTASTGTGLAVVVRGILAITASGTLIPSIALTTAAAGIVKAGSYIIINKIGAATDTTRGSWS